MLRQLRQLRDCSSVKSAKVVSLLLLLLMAGCQSRTGNPDNLIKLPTHVDGASDAQIIKLQTRLNKDGVRVITIGQDYLLSIPSALIFPEQSPQLTWESYQLLNDIVCFLQQFRKVNVNVTAFSSKYVSPQREHALTLARARAVAEYLWSQDIDSRFVFTQGLGSDKPMGAFGQNKDNSPISRIEITFRRAIA